jgi:hypothetical protein
VTDPFDTAAIRGRVLESWIAAAVRFREDANLEEDLVLGGYRDRVLVELAQNAADAAARAALPGRLLLSLRDTPAGPVLTAANTGAPLDAAGVVGLCTLRASGKRDEGEHGAADTAPVGRFGLGFAAVLAVSDEPSVLSRDGGVRFSATQAREAVRQAAERSPDLGAELARRAGRVPALRLPYPAEEAPPWGFDTAVVLPLRDTAAEALVRGLLTGLDDTLLLALPHLSEVTIELDGASRTLAARRSGDECVIADGVRTTRWRLAAAGGGLDRDLLADRPVEERQRPHWSLTWAAAMDADGGPQRLRTAPVVYAPTPTDEPLGLPALLIASFPLEATRRHVAPGPLTDFLLDQASAAYARMVEDWPTRAPELLRLVPGPVADGALDADLRRRIAARLPATVFLPAAAGPLGPGPAADLSAQSGYPGTSYATVGAAEPGHRAEPGHGAVAALAPRDAAVLDPGDEALVALIGGVLPGLLPAGWERDQAALTALGVRRIGPADLAEALAGLDREPAWWGALYAALYGVFGADPGAREALATLPVPLVDGRTVRGARGAVLPLGDLESSALTALGPLGLRIVHPGALAPGSGPGALLERLGAQPAQPRALLADPAVRGAVKAAHGMLPQAEGGGPAELADAVLALVRAAAPGPHERFDLAGLELADDRGRFAPARDLLMPGSPLAEVVEPGAFGQVDPDLVRRWGPEVLRAVGVLDTLVVVRADDVLLDVDGVEEDLLDLDGFAEWIEEVRSVLPAGARDAPAVLTELVAVRDLDLVAPDRWPRALDLLAHGALRDAVTAPARVLPAAGHAVDLPSYTSWWLSLRPVLGGRRPADLATGGGLLDGLYDQVPEPAADPELLVGLGVRSTLSALLDTPGGANEVLDRLADPDRDVGAAQLARLYAALSEVPADLVDPPSGLRAWREGAMVVADAADVLVVDAPDLLAVIGDRPYIAVPARCADALADLLDLDLLSEAIDGAVTSAGEPREVPPEVRDLLPAAPGTYLEHDELILDDVDEVQWRVVDGEVHASTFDGLARALAWAGGRWDRRHFVAALLAEPERAEELAAEGDFE